jgi:hypothetical protein
MLAVKGIEMFKTSQASDVGSIPIARSINPDDSIAFTRTSCWKPALKWPVLDRRWPEVVPIGPNVCRFGLSGWLRRYEPSNDQRFLASARIE